MTCRIAFGNHQRLFLSAFQGKQPLLTGSESTRQPGPPGFNSPQMSRLDAKGEKRENPDRFRPFADLGFPQDFPMIP
jgi:hypothetical protein